MDKSYIILLYIIPHFNINLLPIKLSLNPIPCINSQHPPYLLMYIDKYKSISMSFNNEFDAVSFNKFNNFILVSCSVKIGF